MKKHWWQPWAYESRPWAAMVLGGLSLVVALLVAVVQGSWTALTTVFFGAGCVLCIYGAVVVQLRREYRSTSKWVREHQNKVDR